MKIIFTRDEAVSYDALLRTLDPALETKYHQLMDNDPMVTKVLSDDDKSVEYTVDETFVLTIIKTVSESAPVIGPMCKGVLAAFRSMFESLKNAIRKMYNDAYQRQKMARVAMKEMKLRDQKAAFCPKCAEEHPECAEAFCCIEQKRCGKS